jgi:hypothetical protein
MIQDFIFASFVGMFTATIIAVFVGVVIKMKNYFEKEFGND